MKRKKRARVKPETASECIPKTLVTPSRKRRYYAGLAKWREETGIQDLGISAFIRDALDRRCDELLGR